jgi:3-oxoadipate enol-lactonase/4-carboxymuconolactone decarboxylase
VWEPQIPALSREFQVIRYDLPGHGGAAAPKADQVLTVADLAGGVLALADALGIDRFGYAGISLGGAVGLWLARHHPERVSALALVCSSARFGEPAAWLDRAARVRAHGTNPLVAPSAGRWFTAEFADSLPARGLLADLKDADPLGYAACCDALSAFDFRAELPHITVPTLVIAGREDPATPPAHAREIVDGIPGATLVELPDAAHLANVEQPERATAALLAHFGSSGSDAARYAAGMSVRRAVLGDAHVDHATANATELTAPFQDFITRYAWGEIWTRHGLDRRTRSCITLTALVAHGHLEELAMHVRAARRNGLTEHEIREVLLQTAIYCGVPAANAAFAVANRVLSEAPSTDQEGRAR